MITDDDAADIAAYHDRLVEPSSAVERLRSTRMRAEFRVAHFNADGTTEAVITVEKPVLTVDDLCEQFESILVSAGFGAIRISVERA